MFAHAHRSLISRSSRCQFQFMRKSVSRTFTSQSKPEWATKTGGWTSINQSVIRIEGKDTVKFLNGLCTLNLVDLAKQPAEKSTNQSISQSVAGYTVFLNPKGRFLFEAFIVPDEKCQYLIVPSINQSLSQSISQLKGQSTDQSTSQSTDQSVNHQLLAVQHLSKYNFRNKAKMEEVAASHVVSVNQSINQSINQSVTGLQFVDPRNPALGTRTTVFYQPGEDNQSINQSTDQLFDQSNHVPGVAYDLLRILHGVPSSTLILDDQSVNQLNQSIYQSVNESTDQSANQSTSQSVTQSINQSVDQSINQSVELIVGKSLPLECSLDSVHALSFTKGCYLGQEIIARHKHVGVLRKRTYTVFLQPIKQANNQSVNQSNNQSGSHSVNQSIDRSRKLIAVGEVFDQNHPFDSPLIDWSFPATEIGPVAVTSVTQSIDQSTNESTDQSVNHSINQSTPCGFIYSMHYNAAIAQLRCESVENDSELCCEIRGQTYRIRIVDRPVID